MQYTTRFFMEMITVNVYLLICKSSALEILYLFTSFKKIKSYLAIPTLFQG